MSATDFRVASLNAWHGLTGDKSFFFEELESSASRRERLHRQVEILKSLKADVIALQEVNPLPFRAYWYAERLGMKVFYAAANQGLKLGWGPPFNLNEGLCILVPSDAKVEYLGKRELSGNKKPSILHLPDQIASFLSFQFYESRCAVAVRLFIPQNFSSGRFAGARSIVVVTTHLHHGHSASPFNMNLLSALFESGYLTQKQHDQALALFRRSNSRRIAETERLISWCKRIRRTGEPVIVTGDFNAEPESASVQMMTEAGFSDAWTELNQREKGFTWNPATNISAFRSRTYNHYRKRFGNGVADLFRKAELLPRRIDYIFHRKWHADMLGYDEQETGVIGHLHAIETFGTGDRNGEKPVSDHFGVVATYRRQ